MTNKPNSVRILGERWGIRYDMPEYLDHRRRYGETDHNARQILIDPSTSSRDKETMLHEIIHAADSELSEAVVQLLARVLLQIFRDNPNVVMFLCEDDQEKG